MPSWQSRIASYMSSILLKRVALRSNFDETEAVRFLRQRIEPQGALPRYLAGRLPRGVSHQPITEGNVRGEWLWPAEVPPRTSDTSGAYGSSARELPAPEPDDAGCIFYLHGGGYFAGSPRSHRHLTARLALTTRTRLFSLDYRLAPEHKFPAAVEDAVTAYCWLLDRGEDPARIVIGGDSAGGGLALAALLWIRDAGLPLPAGAFLFSPWTDLAATGDSLVANDESDQMFCGRDVGRFSKVYYGEASPLDPLVSPLYASFHSLPPLRIYASSAEVLLDDSVRLAERAIFDGVPVDLRIWPGLLHAWPVLVRFGIPESMRVVEEVAGFIRERLLAGNPVPTPSPLYANINDNFYPTVVGSLGIDQPDKV